MTDVLEVEHETLERRTVCVCRAPPPVDAAMRVVMAKRLFRRGVCREDLFDAGDHAAGGVESPLIER